MKNSDRVMVVEAKSNVLPGDNLIKIREMPDYVALEVTLDNAGEISLRPRSAARGLNKDRYDPASLRQEVEPWLTALFQSEHLSLLVGAGLTTSVHMQVTGKPSNGFDNRTFEAFDSEIQREAVRSAKASGRGVPNVEDQLRAALMLLDGLRVLLNSETAGTPEEPAPSSAGVDLKLLKSQFDLLASSVGAAIRELVSGILNCERSILAGDEEPREEAFRRLLSFLMSFASRTGTRDRLHLFSTNYDRVLELGAELAGLRLIDRFVGSLAPIFRSSRLDLDFHYNPPGIRGEPRYLEGVARFTKLHGSLDWIQDGRQIRRCALPFGAPDHAPFLGSEPSRCLIYPNSAKDRETASYPYVELFRDLAAALCRPNSTLITYGYSFGDEHINRIIFDMLTIPSTHLVIINYADTGKRLTRFYRQSMRRSQISMMIGNHLGDLKALVDYYLPKPAIDRSTLRMAELLRARGYAPDSPRPPAGSDQSEKDNRP